MMGRREARQGQFFYEFNLDEVVPPEHLVRKIDAVLDLGWVHSELAPYYSHTGLPSIDLELMIRMLIVGYVFAIRSGGASALKCRSIWPTAGFASRASRTRSRIIQCSRGPGTMRSSNNCEITYCACQVRLGTEGLATVAQWRCQSESDLTR